MPKYAVTSARRSIDRLANYCLTIYARIFAKPFLYKWNYFLFNVSLRGLGVLNYKTPSVSGERHFIRRILLNKQEPCVVDVGANVGDYARMVREASPKARIICIEPHPKNIKKLTMLSDLSMEIVANAAGSRPGRIDLFDYAENDGSSHASVYRDVIEEQHHSSSITHTVQIITLDQYCSERGINHIDLLKIDVEGHELEVLVGAKQLLAAQSVDCIQFEFNEMNIISRVFMRDFRALLSNYSLFRMLPKGYIPLKTTGLDELFAFQNIIAIRNGI